MTNEVFFKDAGRNKFFGKTIIENKEEELKHITKSSLFHNIVLLQDELRDAMDERDVCSEAEGKLHEENENLRTIISKLQNEIKELKEQKKK